MREKLRTATAVLFLAILIGATALAGRNPFVSASDTKKNDYLINPNNVVLGVSVLDIKEYGNVVKNTIPSTIPGILIENTIYLNQSVSDQVAKMVNKFISDYKDEYPNKVVMEVYYYFNITENNKTSVYKPPIFKGVDYLVVMPKDYDNYINTILPHVPKEYWSRTFAVITYSPKMVSSNGTNSTSVEFNPSIPLNKIEELKSEGKLYGVIIYTVDALKYGQYSGKFMERVETDIAELHQNNIPVFAVAQPFVSFQTGKPDAMRTIQFIYYLQKAGFDGIVFLDWSSAGIPILYELDHNLFNGKSGINIHKHISLSSTTTILLVYVPTVIIVALIIVAYVRSRRRSERRAVKNSKEEKKAKSSGE